MALTPAEVRAFKQRLLEEQQRLEQELEVLEERTRNASESERATELSGYDDHPADLASETFELEKERALQESIEAMLARVRTALSKIERGTYGICDACGQEISKERLTALPHATLCVIDQSRMETR
jgi:RNA polymerase-binding transcription factor DksA